MNDIETLLTDVILDYHDQINLIRLDRKGAFALEWEAQRVVWIGKGASILEGLGRNLLLLSTGAHGCGPLVGVYKQSGGTNCMGFKFVGGDPEGAYINLWETYKAQGYEVLSRSPSIWRVVEVPIRDPRPEYEGFILCLYWQNQSGRRTLAGAFEKVADARTWVAEKLGGTRETLAPVYRGDNLTRSIRAHLRDVE